MVDNTQEKDRIIEGVLNTLHEAISMAGERGIPSGHLYAMLMDKMDLQTYTVLITTLEASGRITNVGHLLRANTIH